MIAENLDQFFADFGVSATFGAETGQVIFDYPEIFVDADVISAEYKIMYKSTLFAAMKYGDSITVNGTVYRVNTINAIQDGQIKEAILSK